LYIHFFKILILILSYNKTKLFKKKEIEERRAKDVFFNLKNNKSGGMNEGMKERKERKE
jgi:hypothetical protein